MPKVNEVEIIPGKHLGGFSLVGAAPETCSKCGIAHNPHYPHNQQSLFWQYQFYNEHGRWPTWKDAMAHCPDDIKELWSQELRKLGIQI